MYEETSHFYFIDFSKQHTTALDNKYKTVSVVQFFAKKKNQSTKVIPTTDGFIYRSYTQKAACEKSDSLLLTQWSLYWSRNLPSLENFLNCFIQMINMLPTLKKESSRMCSPLSSFTMYRQLLYSELFSVAKTFFILNLNLYSPITTGKVAKCQISIDKMSVTTSSLRYQNS